MRRIVIFLTLLLIPLLSFAQTMTQPSKQQTSNSIKTHEFQLNNGMKLIVREDHRAPIVFSSVWYRVGGSYERNGITGISHVLEHMMFRGTQQVGPGQLERLISENGGRQNAMTGDDMTMYFQFLPANRLELSFRLEADRMRNLLLDSRVFAKELQVVMEERRMRVEDNPSGLTRERFRAAAFVNNPYHHPVVGWMTDLRNMTVYDLRQWYRQWYTPNNAVAIVVGDVNPQRVLQLAQQYFGAIPRNNLPSLKPRTEVVSLGLRQVTVAVPAKVPLLLMGYNVPVLGKAKEEWVPYAIELLAGVLSQGDSARFPRNLVRGQQVAVSIGAGYPLYSLHNSLFTITAVPAKNHTMEQLQQAIFNEITQLQNTLVGESELQRVKAQIIAQNVFSKDSLMQQGMDLGYPEMTGRTWRDADAYVARVKTVTPEQVREVARRFLIKNNLTVAILKPTTLTTSSRANVPLVPAPTKPVKKNTARNVTKKPRVKVKARNRARKKTRRRRARLPAPR